MAAKTVASGKNPPRERNVIRYAWMSEWTIVEVLKTFEGKTSVGSNPTPGAIPGDYGIRQKMKSCAAKSVSASREEANHIFGNPYRLNRCTINKTIESRLPAIWGTPKSIVF